MHVSARRGLLSLLAFALAMALACTGGSEDDRVAAPAPPTASATAAESATPAPVATPTRAATAAPTPAPAVTPTATVVALPAPTPTATATPPPTVVATPATRCATTTAADCIRAVYKGAPDDYAQVADIPAAALLTPDADGRYRVERGQQVTVVTAAPLPEGWTRFWLDWSPLGVRDALAGLGLAADPAGGHDLHLHGHGGRGRLHADHLRPEAGAPVRAPAPRRQAGDRRHRRDDRLLGRDHEPALQLLRHDRRGGDGGQLRLPRGPRRHDERRHERTRRCATARRRRC